MVDLLLQMALSNTCFALAIAGVAVLVGAKGKRPQLAYALWLLVLVKLVTPPALTIPIGLPQVQSTLASMTQPQMQMNTQPNPGPLLQGTSLLISFQSMANQAKPWLVSIWLAGSMVALTWSLVRVRQFNRRLRANSVSAPLEMETETETIAKRLGLSVVPEISITTAPLSPMVWWTGGRVRVVMPSSLLDQMEPGQWRWVLAHELAHVHRSDYLVRWLEWLVSVGFWWNPLVSWAQRNLRDMEEMCCDALVLSSLKPKPHTYAASILTAVETLVRPVLRPPAMASAINSGSFLERRFSMIITDRVERTAFWRWVQISVLVLMMGLLPLGIGCGSDSGSDSVGEDLTGPSAKMEADDDGLEIRSAEERSEREHGVESIDINAIEYRIQEIEAAVEQGTISPEEGRRLIEETRRGAETDDSPRDEEEALREFQRGVAERAMAIPPEEWNDRLKAAIVRAGWDLNEFTEGIRMRQAAMRDGERTEDSEESEDDRIWREAMATDPDEWSEELKAQLLELAPGRAIEDIAGWIRQRQEAMREGEATNVAGDGE